LTARPGAGTANAPLARYDDSVLFAIATPMKPRAFRFDAAAPVPPATANKGH
jgi:hypothetical protein